ncbi:hypothetical protein PF008_g20226 [Phytophthora fragariae]|uniref:Uncharacterized protein n=1 Tax=Phytophthora fragariae TaxID=53985 RepID=A0A6G0R0E3_9STRA|nr:hypothetical protein PF008_g20226 [Phytophthora fragariae]
MFPSLALYSLLITFDSLMQNPSRCSSVSAIGCRAVCAPRRFCSPILSVIMCGTVALLHR